MADAYFANVALLLHCDGTNGSTSFSDDGPASRTVTAEGDAQISTAQSKWGGASARLDGSGDRLSVASNTGFGFGTASWTVEAWVRLDNLSSDQTVVDFRRVYVNEPGFLAVAASTGCLYYSDGWDFYGLTGAAVSAATWTHIAWTYDGTTLRAFVGGTLAWSVTISLNFLSSAPARIGERSDDGGFLTGYLDDLRITKGVARYTAGFSAPTEAFPGLDAVSVHASAAGPLGAALTVGQVAGAAIVSTAGPLASPRAALAVEVVTRCAAPSPLSGERILLSHDFSSFIAGLTPIYLMDLTTPGGLVRVPISSWQATLQTDSKSYAQCVIPACEAYLDDINAATAFRIVRRTPLVDGRILEYEMLSSPVDTSSIAQGASNYTATISGYSDAVPADEDPPAAYLRELQDVRTVFSQASGIRVRCSIDWLLRPAWRASVNGTPFIVSYINSYCSDGDQYMDVGERVPTP